MSGYGNLHRFASHRIARIAQALAIIGLFDTPCFFGWMFKYLLFEYVHRFFCISAIRRLSVFCNLPEYGERIFFLSCLQQT